MDPNKIISTIKEYENSLSKILSRFIRNRDGVHIERSDDPVLRQHVHELVDLFSEIRLPVYANQIAGEFNDGVSNFTGSPSYKSVENILSIVRAALTKIERSLGGPAKASSAQMSFLHADIIKKCSKLLEAGAYPEAVELSFKIVRDRLRKLTGFETGSDAFGKGGLYILGAAAPNGDQDFNDGTKFLMMAIDRFRNEKSHTSEGNVQDVEHAFQYMMVSSLALRFLDRAQVKT